MASSNFFSGRRSVSIAYLLWLFGGMAGAHKFYLEKVGLGIIYFFTGGIFGLGWLMDLFTLSRQVENFNSRRFYEEHLHSNGQTVNPLQSREFLDGNPNEKERLVLSIARDKRGLVTPMDIAVDSPINLDEAKGMLDDFVTRGYADMEVTDTGMVVYRIFGLLEESKE